MLIGVGVIIERNDGRILLGHRTYGGREDCWCLPGGKVDAGETFEAAAARETLEECAIALPALHPFAILLDTHADAPRVTACCHARVPDAAPRVMEPEKLDRWQWFSPDDLPLNLFAATARVLALWRGEAPEGATAYPLAQAS
jgi:ADP-ribose pyrophosphatase YjhB (NUDIX family)